MLWKRKAATFTLLVVTTLLRAQTVTLTAGQAAAIKGAEDRYNTQELGDYPFGSITFTLDSINHPPPTKGTLSPEPKPGTVAVRGIEHVAGGKQPVESQGYRTAVYWLEPQGGDKWKAGYPVFSSTGYAYPTYAAAYANLHQDEHSMQQVKDFAIASILKVAGVVAVVGFFPLMLFLGFRSRAKAIRVNPVICPKCRTINTFPPRTCENCTSTNTVVEFQYPPNEQTPFIQRCNNCKQVTVREAVCERDGVDLRGIIASQAGKLTGALKGAQTASKFHNQLKR